MSDSNPFDDLAEDNGNTEDNDRGTRSVELESETRPDEESTTDMDSSTRATTNTESNTTASPQTSSSSQDASIEGPTLSNSSPPFPYSDAEQKQMYVQNGLWDEFKDLEFDAELELRRTFEVRNVEQREIDTAVIRLVLDQLAPREIAEMVIQMRGFDPSNFK